MALRFWRDGGCAIVVFEGRYEPEAALVAIDEALNESDERAVGLLLDLSESESFRSRSTEGLRLVAHFLAERRDRFSSRLATVGTSDLAYGLLRMAMVFATDKGIQSAAFRSRDEAVAWLRRDGQD